jgi:simple sugar transport system substrate-binding protein/basic membrane protein A
MARTFVRSWRGLRVAVGAVGAGVLAVALVACSSSGGKSGSGSSSGSGSKTVVGFIMVGSDKDYGYNQAVADGAAQLAKDNASVKVLTADNIPETDQVTQAMQSMVDKGAKVIFATSYGYFKYAQAFATAHPDVVVLHQGGFIEGTPSANFGSYWGQAFEPVSLGGMAAGAMTKSNKLGYVYAFPIPQTLANIDAFELGAQKTNPKAQTYLVNTSNWCDPLKQKEAASALLSQGVDVLTQHQDCQTTVIQAAKAANAYVVGYHEDAKELYPDGWLTGSVWKWAGVYEDIVKTVQDGKFAGSKYNGNWVGSFATNDNPLELASFGNKVPADLQKQITDELASLKQPGNSVFKGPVYCQDGTVLFKAGEVPTYDQINNINCLVKGVVGDLPKS